MDKCLKNMTLVALNIFGLMTILDFFQNKRSSDYFAVLLFLALWRASLFFHFVFGLLDSTTGRGPHFLLLGFGVYEFRLTQGAKLINVIFRML